MLEVGRSSLLKDFPRDGRRLGMVYSCGTGDRGGTMGVEGWRGVGDRVLLAFKVHGGAAGKETYGWVVRQVGGGARGLGRRFAGIVGWGLVVGGGLVRGLSS